MTKKVLAVVIGVCAISSATADAQVPWESPQLLAPATQAGMSMLYVDYGLSPADGTGVLLTYRPPDAPHGIGLRLAGTIPQRDDIRLSGGVDVSRPLVNRSATFPLDVIWTSGVGGSYGDFHSIAVPVGVSAGRWYGSSRFRVQPYVSARVVFEGYLGSDRPDETVGYLVAADAGLDASLHRSRRVLVRAAVSLGDRRALAIGLQVSPGHSTAARTAVVR